MKKRISLAILILLLIGTFSACRNEILVEPTPAPAEEPIETPAPEPEPDCEPEPIVDESEEWPSWIDTDEPHWWNKPGWGIATTIDGTMWTMNLYFNAPPVFRRIAEEMAITHYLNLIHPDMGFYHHTFPLISAAAEGDLTVRSRIVEVLASRIVALREIAPELYHTYMAHFSDRSFVYDEVTRDIFLELQDMLTRVPQPEITDLPELSVSDMLNIFAARALEEPVEDEMLPTLIPVEDMQLFLGSPAAFLEVIHSAGAPFYGWGQYGPTSDTPIGTWELDRFAWYIVSLRFTDSALYAFYHDFLASVAKLDLSELAQQSFDFLLAQIEEIYDQQREWRDA